ncbi:MAG: hypothetical protein J6J18_10345 [Oscillospiraceae bacterium]|nr:hypothetical protein [Oscillospiraceae bacterium]
MIEQICSPVLHGLARMFVMLVPFLILTFFNYKWNLRRKVRYKQFAMPLLALVFCFIAVHWIYDIYDLAYWLLEQIPIWLADFARWFSDNFPEMEKTVMGWVTAFATWFKTLNLKYWAFYVANAVLMLIYLICKLIALPILKLLSRKEGGLFQLVVGIFYEFDEELGKWHLASHYGQGRTFLKTLYISVVMLGVAATFVTSKLYLTEQLLQPIYPAFGVILVGELFFFLNGLTKEELHNAVVGEADDAERICDYSIMRRVLRKLFPDKLNAENTTVCSTREAIATTDELLTELENSDKPHEETYGRFMRYKSEAGMELDRNYLLSGRQLLNGQSVLFNNPFYYDLIPYIFYPMNRCLLRHKKVLIILGRHGAEENVQSWCVDGLTAVTNVPTMWNIGVLSEEPQELDVGIITRSSVHDLKLHESNQEFFDQTEFVVLIEPSRLVTTAQVGLNSIIRHCRRKEKQLVYCSADKNCDGLVDALSHILMTSLKEVSATNHHTGASSYMIWEADNEHLQHRMLPNLSRYLGMGTELSFAALKNQIPVTHWYGGDAFPVVDIHWIAKQYYYDLLNYANLPTDQEVVDRIFRVSVDMWSARERENQYITVEDESYNMFEVKRDFATRAKEQGFVNVICSEYLLKDYMADNDSIFNADPKAIPYITADYARTVRNVALRLCLRMSAGPVPEREIAREMLMIDRDSKYPIKALWHAICESCGHAGQAVVSSAGRETLLCRTADDAVEFGMDVLIPKRKFSMETGVMETMYTITDHRFIRLILGGLKPAQYIAEDENGQRMYLGMELSGHVFQKYLPGQFFTFGGKYYEMLRVTSDAQVLVRRASDHIEGRPTYRQVRSYFLSAAVDSTVMGECRDLGTMRVTRQFADIRVETPAYYALDRYNDLAHGKRVGINGVPDRIYNNKSILRIDLNPGSEIPAKTVNTLTQLVNEVLRTLLAENQDYLVAITPGQAELPATYSLAGEKGFEPRNGSIYIIEDSQMDIGLLDAVERNLNRIFAIICDYLQWHNDALERSLNPPPEPEQPQIEEVEQPQPEEKVGFFGKIKRFFKKIFDTIKNFFKKLFGKKVKGDPVPETQDPEIPAEETPVAEPVETAEEPLQSTMLFDETNDTVEYEPETTQKAADNPIFERKPYHKRYYLLYGAEALSENVDVAGVLDLLLGLGYGNSALTQARKGTDVAGMIERSFVPNRTGVHYCDFCGCELTGLEYDILGDGRERCTNCSRTAVKSAEEFQALHDAVLRNMQVFFGVKINAPVHVQMVNSKKLHRKLGKSFVPTGSFDGRVLGVAIRSRDGYSILVENGAPRLQATMTMVHEMTHIWQYLNWNEKEILNRYGQDQNLEIYEGMAKWVEIQYAYLLGEIATGKREELITRSRDDAYGKGFVKYAGRYPLSIGPLSGRGIPFDDPKKPL